MPDKRPTGVTILAVLYFIGAAVLVIFGLLLMAGGSMMSSMLGGDNSGFFAALGAALGILLIVFAVIPALMGFGLWAQKSWGWWIATILTALGLLSGAVGIVRGEWSNLVGLLLNGFILWYFLEPGVQRWFRVGPMKMPWHKTMA